MDKWERRAKARDTKQKKRRSHDMVVKGRSLISTIVPVIKKKSEEQK